MLRCGRVKFIYWIHYFLFSNFQLLSQEIYFLHVKTLLTFRKSLIFWPLNTRLLKCFHCKIFNRKKEWVKSYIRWYIFSFPTQSEKFFFSDNKIYMEWLVSHTPSLTDYPNVIWWAGSYTEILFKRNTFRIWGKTNRETDFLMGWNHWFRKEWRFLSEIYASWSWIP